MTPILASELAAMDGISLLANAGASNINRFAECCLGKP